METTDKELEEKKTLLKTEILDKNYDQSKFIEFCLTTKPNGDDLTKWSIEELKSTIKEFSSKYPPINTYQQNQQINTIQKDIENMNIDQEKQQQQKSQPIKLKCKILEKTELNDKKITVIIKNPKPIITNFLSSNYVEYEVETSPLNWLVKRRYSDFEWLRQVLTKFCPGIVIPPLPNKKIGSRRFRSRI